MDQMTQPTVSKRWRK